MATAGSQKTLMEYTTQELLADLMRRGPDGVAEQSPKLMSTLLERTSLASMSHAAKEAVGRQLPYVSDSELHTYDVMDFGNPFDVPYIRQMLDSPMQHVDRLAGVFAAIVFFTVLLFLRVRTGVFADVSPAQVHDTNLFNTTRAETVGLEQRTMVLVNDFGDI